MRGGAWALALAMGAFAPLAHAQQQATPQVAFEVTPGTAGGPWKLVVRNDGELPVRIPADPRLLVLDLFPQSPTPKQGTVRCALPIDARPSTDEGRELVVPGKRSWSATFDPLYYCFHAKERALLVPGTTVKARFGWPEPLVPPKRRARAKKRKDEGPLPPFVVSPVGAAVGQLAPVKALEGSTFTLTEAVTAAPPPASAAAASGTTDPGASDASKPALAISATEATDVARGVDIPITVTVTNESDRRVTLFLRTSTLLFTVNGPAGSVSCGQAASSETPPRELFTTIASKHRSQTTLLVTAVCPPDTFDAPGIYRIVPKLDTRGTSGRNLGLRTWDGLVVAKVPSLVRVRTERRPEPPKKPKLD